MPPQVLLKAASFIVAEVHGRSLVRELQVKFYKRKVLAQTQLGRLLLAQVLSPLWRQAPA
jgi:hypothetical protein